LREIDVVDVITIEKSVIKYKLMMYKFIYAYCIIIFSNYEMNQRLMIVSFFQCLVKVLILWESYMI